MTFDHPRKYIPVINVSQTEACDKTIMDRYNNQHHLVEEETKLVKRWEIPMFVLYQINFDYCYYIVTQN